MKINLVVLLVLFVFQITAGQNSSQKSRNIKELTVFKENRYPKSVAFRSTEYALRRGVFYVDAKERLLKGEKGYLKKKISSTEFIDAMKSFSVVMGKSIDEERTGGTNNVRIGYNQLKKKNPEKAVILHFNGRARRPEYKVGDKPFYPGYYLYQTPDLCLSDISATTQNTVIKVASIEPYINAKNKLLPKQIICLYAVDNGIRNFNYSEYVIPIAVNVEQKTVTVKRAQFGTKALSFKSEKAEIASGAVVANRLLYNFSTTCPKDAKGRRCIEALIDDIAFLFGRKGELEKFDGLIFDAATVSAANLEFNGRIDLNMDGEPDNGGYDGETFLPLLGYLEFSKLLRQRMGDDFIILGDARTAWHHRSFEYFNGTESEGWPQKRDADFLKQWSSGIARHIFLDEHLKAPKLHQFNAYSLYTESKSHERLVQAAAACTNAAYCGKYLLDQATNEVVGYTDEMSKGVENDFSGWLGKPVGEIQRLAERSENLASTHLLKNNVFQPSTKETFYTGMPVSVLKVKGIEAPATELYIKVKIKGAPFKSYKEKIPRVCSVTVKPSGTEKRKLSKSEKRLLNAKPDAFTQEFYIDEDGESIGLYLRWLTHSHVDLDFKIEGVEQAVLESMEVYNAPDVIYREFENGVVIGNPSLKGVTVNIKELFPNLRLQRLKGRKDKEANNGTMIGEQLSLGALDGLFLKKISKY